MVKRKSKKTKGFTLIELLIVVVIIGILVSIALPNFVAAQERARYSNLKTNMHMVQSMAETYSIDWGAMYPDDRDTLYKQATAGDYWTPIRNPITGEEDKVLDMEKFTKLDDIQTFGVVFAGHKSKADPGNDIHPGFYNAPPDISSYAVYGAGLYKEPFKVKGQYFYYSNY